MNITRNNCEAFFLDYHEGRLTPLQVSELMLFLEKHSDLKQIFESFENISLEEELVSFSGKDALKKDTSSNVGSPSFEELCVADVEGEISSAQKKELNKLISENSSLNKEYQLYKKTKLVPEAIIFEDKFLLKKRVRKPFVVNRYYYVAAAASVLLILGLFFLFRNDNAVDKVEIANNNKKESVSPEQIIPAPENVIVNNNVVADVNKNSVAVKKNKRVFPETNNKQENQIIVPEKQKQDEPQLVNNEEKKELPKLPELKKEEAPIVIAENKKPTTSNEEYLSLKEAVVSKIKSNLLADELPEQEMKGDNGKKLRAWDILALAAKGVRKLTGKDVAVKHKYDNNNQVVASAFNIGNFGVERTVAAR